MDDFYFLVGSINKSGNWFNAVGRGLSVLSLNRRSGSFTHIADEPAIENVIWLKATPFGFLAASEQYLQNGKIFSFSIDQNRRVTIHGDVREANGGAICHIETIDDDNLAIVTSFFGGLSLHHYDKTGALSDSYQTFDYPGKSVKPMQDKSHPHQSTLTPDKKQVLVCDLGNDTIWKHHISIKNGMAYLEKGKPLAVDIGAGPRHLVFHPTLPLFYLLGQLNGKVATYRYSEHEIRLENLQAILPPSFSGEMSAAAIKIHPSGKTIYMTERQYNMVAVFEITPIGELKKNTHFSCGGQAPRDFLFSDTGDWLIVLNHDSDTIVSFRINPSTGLPDTNPVETFSFGCAVCGLSLNSKV